MRILLSILLLHFATISLNAQYRSYVDVVPFAEQCDVEETSEDKIECSELVLLSYFLDGIDTTVCPTSDTASMVSVVLEVNKKGKYSATVRSHSLRESCLVYLEEKAKEMPDEISLIPARLDGKKTNFNKKIQFMYPDSTYGTNLADSAGDPAFKWLASMPRFYSAKCEEMMGGDEDKNNCSKGKLLEFIYGNLKYPKLAREDGVQGMVVTRFIIDKEGYVNDLNLLRDIGAGCGEASLAVIRLLNEQDEPPFVAGMQNGEIVKVQYTMPIRFKLESGRKSKKRRRDRK